MKLPDEFRFADGAVSIRKEGKAVVLEPVEAKAWPSGFFAAIRIDDSAFVRPPQGVAPPMEIATVESKNKTAEVGSTINKGRSWPTPDQTAGRLYQQQ